jgi:hypothetical protein
MSLLIQYSAGKEFASAVIRRLTHSPFSHIDIVLPGEGLLGVSGPYPHDIGGVRVRQFNPWPYMSEPKVARLQCSEEVARKTIEWGRSQIGVPFDNGALYHFLRDRGGLSVEGRNWREPAQWFCSEFVIRAVEIGGLFPYKLVVTKDVISPGDTLLLFNPYMPQANIEEFLE